MPRLRSRSAAFITVACLCVFAPSGTAQAPRYDILITGGTLIDGSGSPRRPGGLAIKDGRIAAVGVVPKGTAGQIIDATGLIVAPGFIDVHTHADDIAEHPRAENFVRMGVTTIVAGNCGGSALDVGEALTNIRAGRRVGQLRDAHRPQHRAARRHGHREP